MQVKLFSVFLFFVFWFPQKYFYVYFLLSVALTSLLSLVLGLSVKKVVFFFLFLSLLVLVNNSYAISELNGTLRNLSEFARYIFLTVLLSISFSHKGFQEAFKMFFLVYLLLNFLLSCIQYFAPDVYPDILFNMYNNEKQVDLSLMQSGRSIGLNQGPAENALISGVGAFFFSSLYMQHPTRSYLAVIILSILSLLMSQSQTALLSLIAGYIVFFVLHMKKSYVYFVRASLLFPFFLYGLYVFMINNSYLSLLISEGLSRNSFQARLIKWEEVYSAYMNDPTSLFFSLGKDFFNFSHAMDNEYVFAVTAWGIVPTILLLLFFLVTFIKNLYLKKKLKSYNDIYLSIVAFLFVASMAMATITDIRLMIILVIMSSLYSREAPS